MQDIYRPVKHADIQSLCIKYAREKGINGETIMNPHEKKETLIQRHTDNNAEIPPNKASEISLVPKA